jgi:hypothetical protein
VDIEIADSDDSVSNRGLRSSGFKAAELSMQLDDDEDQDVLIRQRSDRASRTRRPPAKFRDDDMWN